HHTLLTTRRLTKTPTPPADDVLIPPGADPEMIAFIRALRQLPHQQSEALLLQRGEGYDLRTLSTAMDCSTEAAGNHLDTARRQLREITGERFDTLISHLTAAYRRIEPDQQLAVPLVKKAARRYLWPRRLWRIVRWLLILIFFILTAWIILYVWPRRDYVFELRLRPRTSFCARRAARPRVPP